jgi:hypothetical protein
MKSLLLEIGQMQPPQGADNFLIAVLASARMPILLTRL